MISRNGKNAFGAHWDWIVCAAGIAMLVLVAVWKFVLAGDPEEGSGARAAKAAAPAAPVSMKIFEAVSANVAKPPRIAAVPDAKGSFLASELRVFCSQGDPDDTRKTCGRPIPFPVDKCPVCGARQKAADKPPEFEVDSDGDGIKDEWEKKYGLNPADASDAEADKDGDGFTNLEEFVAGTDPSDSASHPDYLDQFKVDPELKQTYITIVFTGSMKTPRGMQMKFTDPSRTNTDPKYRGRYSVLAGEDIGDTGYAAKSFEQKFRVEKMGGGMEKKVDASEAKIVRKSDGREIVLALGCKQTPVDVKAKILYDRLGGKTYEVAEGAVISLNGLKYAVSKIEKTAQGASVVLENAATGRKRVVKSGE